MSRSICQTNLVSLISKSCNVTFSHCPPVCEAWSKVTHLPEPKSLREECTRESRRCHQIQEGALLSGCTDPEQGGGGPESKRANLPKVMLFYLVC